MRKPVLSPTKISIYLACPVKYNWTYLDARGRWYLRAKNYYSFGSSLHKVLQRFHDEGDQGVKTTGEALAALEQSWIEAGYSSAQEMQEALGEGKGILQSYIEFYQSQPVTSKTLYVEKMFRMDLGKFALIGRVDRIDELADGTLEIIDYKSGRSSVTTEEVRNDLAMSSYQLLLKEKFLGRSICASVIAIRTQKKATASLSSQELSQFKNNIIDLGEEILNRDYQDIVPIWKEICPTCDFLSLCKKHPDFNPPDDNK